MEDKSSPTYLDDRRIHWGYRLALALCIAALLTSVIAWIITNDSYVKIGSLMTLFGAVIAIIIIWASIKSEREVNKMIRKARS